MAAPLADGPSKDQPSRAGNKLWSQDAMAEIALLRARADIIYYREKSSYAIDAENAGEEQQVLLPRRDRLAPEAQEQRTWQETKATCEAVRGLLRHAELAAKGRHPKYRVILSWWSGNCIEAAFRNAHNAEATLAVLYNASELRAEIPEAVRRARESLRPGDPVRDVAQRLLDSRIQNRVCSATDLSRVVEAGHAAADRQRSRLRTFRNVLLTGIIIATLLLSGVIGLAAWRPSLIPLCFVQNPPPSDLFLPNISCPTRSLRATNSVISADVPSRLDFFVVAVLGLLGGALSAALFIRDLYSNATPYNISVPLAILKLPAGALTGLIGIILLAGEFVPGFSAIDKQIQILAYALVFGFAQQLFTQFVDQRAQRLVDNVPTKAREISGPGYRGRATDRNHNRNTEDER